MNRNLFAATTNLFAIIITLVIMACLLNLNLLPVVPALVYPMMISAVLAGVLYIVIVVTISHPFVISTDINIDSETLTKPMMIFGFFAVGSVILITFQLMNIMQYLKNLAPFPEWFYFYGSILDLVLIAAGFWYFLKKSKSKTAETIA